MNYADGYCYETVDVIPVPYHGWLTLALTLKPDPNPNPTYPILTLTYTVAVGLACEH